MPVLTGALRGGRWVVGTGTNGCWVGTYERLTQEWVRRLLGRGMVAFDVGANVGFFTLLASRIVGASGSVVSFEPLSENLGALRRHIAINGVTNVKVVAAAVSDSCGHERFAVAPDPAMGSLSEDGPVVVATVALDDLVHRGEIPAPGFLKIDVEGAELRVLEGAREVLSAGHPPVVVSAHGWQLYEACSAFLRDVGYRVTLAKDGAADGDYLLAADCLEGRP